jgi:hypothetical protein
VEVLAILDDPGRLESVFAVVEGIPCLPDWHESLGELVSLLL